MKKGKMPFRINNVLVIALLFLLFAVIANVFVNMFQSAQKKERRELFENMAVGADCNTGMCTR